MRIYAEVFVVKRWNAYNSTLGHYCSVGTLLNLLNRVWILPDSLEM
jgi:hypothetical protein